MKKMPLFARVLCMISWYFSWMRWLLLCVDCIEPLCQTGTELRAWNGFRSFHSSNWAWFDLWRRSHTGCCQLGFCFVSLWSSAPFPGGCCISLIMVSLELASFLFAIWVSLARMLWCQSLLWCLCCWSQTPLFTFTTPWSSCRFFAAGLPQRSWCVLWLVARVRRLWSCEYLRWDRRCELLVWAATLCLGVIEYRHCCLPMCATNYSRYPWRNNFMCVAGFFCR